MALFDSKAARTARPVPRDLLGKMTLAAGVIGLALTSDEYRGIYFRPDDESLAFAREHGIDLRNVTSGVMRAKDIAGGKGGEIAKHVGFVAVPPDPTLMVLSAVLTTQMSIVDQLEKIQDYLKEMDHKLDRLMRQRKLEVTGLLGGVVLAIDEAETVQSATGHVSEVTWSKVQANSLVLQQIQAEAVAQLAAIADEIIACKDDVDELAKVVRRETEGVQFWLGVLARAVATQDRQHLLELARVEAQHPDQLEAHRRGLVAARSHRLGRITDALRRINESLVGAGTLTNFGYVANPLSSRAVTRGSEEITGHVLTFAAHADVNLDDLGQVEGKAWLSAVRGLAGDVKSGVDDTASTAARRVGQFSRVIKTAGEERALARAERIRARRAAGAAVEDASADTDTEA